VVEQMSTPQRHDVMHSKEFWFGAISGRHRNVHFQEGIRMSIQSCKHAIYHLLQVQLYSHSAGSCTSPRRPVVKNMLLQIDVHVGYQANSTPGLDSTVSSR
jgi:hypothetical protein